MHFLLSDHRQARKFIEDGTDCPYNILLDYYIWHKKMNKKVPVKLDEFVTGLLEEIVTSYNDGVQPKYNDIFKFKFKQGRKSKSYSAKTIALIEITKSYKKYRAAGMTFDKAVEQVQKDRHISASSVKQAITAYRKNWKSISELKSVSSPSPE